MKKISFLLHDFVVKLFENDYFTLGQIIAQVMKTYIA